MPLEKNPTGIFNDRELFGSERNDHESDSFDALTKRVEVGAEGGSRTRTTLRSTDFKSVASAIPPPRHVRKNSMAYERQQTSCVIEGV